MAPSEPRGIQSIEVSGRILNVLLETTGAVMLKDIAAKTDMAAAQVHAYLSSFKRMDLVVQDPGDGRYSLGALALRLGLAYRDSYAPLRNASETLAVVEAPD
jgi:DNA-binding IclR family transcriptional regulator